MKLTNYFVKKIINTQIQKKTQKINKIRKIEMTRGAKKKLIILLIWILISNKNNKKWSKMTKFLQAAIHNKKKLKILNILNYILNLLLNSNLIVAANINTNNHLIIKIHFHPYKEQKTFRVRA